MRIFITVTLCLLIWMDGLAQRNNSESLFRIDTVQISPSVKKMIFKYFINYDGYENQVEKKIGRFEIFYLGEFVPLQMDTIFDIEDVDYEDANYDNILDIKIITNTYANGQKSVDYYFYNTNSQKYEYGIGDLTDPTLNKKDSTISTESHCCQGREGGNELYKYLNGKLKLIIETSGTESNSYRKELRGDSLVTTMLETTSSIDGGKLADSTWEYSFGRLRIMDVQIKKPFDKSSEIEPDDGEVEVDVRGAFILYSEETFRYQMDEKKNIVCSYVLNKVKNKEWIVEKESQWFFKN